MVTALFPGCFMFSYSGKARGHPEQDEDKAEGRAQDKGAGGGQGQQPAITTFLTLDFQVMYLSLTWTELTA